MVPILLDSYYHTAEQKMAAGQQGRHYQRPGHQICCDIRLLALGFHMVLDTVKDLEKDSEIVHKLVIVLVRNSLGK